MTGKPAPGSTRPRLRWAWSYEWHALGTVRLAAAGAVAALLSVIVVGHAAWRAQQALRVQQQAMPVDTALNAVPLTSALLTVVPDFTSSLPMFGPGAGAMSVMQDAARRSGLAIDSMQSSESPPTVDRLGHVELVVTGRGDYAAIKRWTGESLARMPGSSLTRLQVQRTAGSSDLEVQAVWRVWSRPLTAAGGR